MKTVTSLLGSRGLQALTAEKPGAAPGAKSRAEDGVACAVEIIERRAGRRTP